MDFKTEFPTEPPDELKARIKPDQPTGILLSYKISGGQFIHASCCHYDNVEENLWAAWELLNMSLDGIVSKEFRWVELVKIDHFGESPVGNIT